MRNWTRVTNTPYEDTSAVNQTVQKLEDIYCRTGTQKVKKRIPELDDYQRALKGRSLQFLVTHKQYQTIKYARFSYSSGRPRPVHASTPGPTRSSELCVELSATRASRRSAGTPPRFVGASPRVSKVFGRVTQFPSRTGWPIHALNSLAVPSTVAVASYDCFWSGPSRAFGLLSGTALVCPTQVGH